MKTKSILGLAATCLIMGNMAFATVITPSYKTWGPLAGATFGGTGIPNNPVAATTEIVNGNDTITLGLTATQRYFNPTVGNDGAGTFFATPGANYGTPATPTTPGTPSLAQGPTWNFDWYINLADNTTAGYSYALLYGNNTTGASTLLSFGSASNTSGTWQDSWNLSMGFLNTISFDPNANGVYGFELQAFDAAGKMLGETAINVNVSSSVPDAASSTLLLGLGLGSLLLLGYRQNRLAITK